MPLSTETPAQTVSRPMPNKKFRVRVGLAECTVSCQTEQEAVRIARRQLNDELPGMGDVIKGILDKEFRVDPAE